MADSFVHLHVHTEYSMLDGAAKNGKLIAEAERQGMPAVAMSDHGNMFGAYEFFQTAKTTAVKPIIGIEAYLAPESRHYKKPVFWGRGGVRGAGSDGGEGGKDVSGGGRFTHMTMWAKNAQGLRNLFRMSSIASIEGQFPAGKPRMDMELIAENSEGIIGTTGCPSGAVQTRLRLGQWDEAVNVAAAYQDILGKENYFLELMDHGLDIERDVRADLLKLADHLGIPLLATNDSHYVTADQADAHDSLLCIGVGKNKDDPNRFKFSGSGYYVKTATEMRELFSELPQACDNTLLIAEMIEPYNEVFDYVDRMPQFDVPEGETQESWLRKVTMDGLRDRYGDPVAQKYLDRFETEMKVIGPMGFSSYFLVVSDICQYARKNGIALGPGRGSATGSIVAYATGITELCPLEHGLLFERFLNPERINPPDVDLDFDDRQRDQMVRYVTEKYGSSHTAQVNTFGTIKAKAAVKDASRILGYPFAMGDRITKAMPPDANGKGVPLAKLFDKDHPRYSEGAEIRSLIENEPDVRKIYETGLGIEGLVRGTGVHAAAVILSSEPLIDLVPLHMRAKDGVMLTGFDYPSCENLGLIKMDFLGLRNLGIIDHAIKTIEQNRGVKIETAKIPLDDKKTYELLARGDTLGVFQLDGAAMRQLLRLMVPNQFEDLSAVGALYRPGPMGANTHINYAHRKNGRQEVLPVHPELKEALEPILGLTYHLLVYQEQVMAIARELAGYSFGGADLLRRAMGKKKPEVLAAEFEKFHSGMNERGFSDEACQAVWDVMLPFSGYGFNKSHSAAYGLVSYWTAYLKANYPAEYMAALLTSVGDDKDKSAVYLADARSKGIRVLSPDVNESVADFTAVGDDVRFGLQAVRNVGLPVIDSLIAARRGHGKFTSFQDFLDKVPLPVCNKRAIDSMIRSGAFDSLGHTRQGLAAVAENAIESVIGVKKQQAIGQDDLFGTVDDGSGVPGIGMDFTIGEREWPRKQLLSQEREMLGLYVSGHPLDGAEHILARNRDTSMADVLGSGRTEGMIKLAGLITAVDKRINKGGNAWAIISLADRDAEMEVLFFPKAYLLVQHELIEDNVIAVSGRLNERDGTISVFGEAVQALDISSAEHGGLSPILITLPESKIRPKVIAEMKHSFSSHPGQTPVRLKVVGREKTTVYELGFLIDPDTVASEIKSLLGTGVWSLA